MIEELCVCVHVISSAGWEYSTHTRASQWVSSERTNHRARRRRWTRTRILVSDIAVQEERRVHSPHLGVPPIHSPHLGVPPIHSPHLGVPPIHSPHLGVPPIHSPHLGVPPIHSPHLGVPPKEAIVCTESHKPSLIMQVLF